MKKLLSSFLAALMLCGTVITSSMAADTKATVNTIQLKGAFDSVAMTFSYDTTTLKIKAESNGYQIHNGFYDSPYVTFSYFNADNTLRFKEVVTGIQDCNKLASILNNTSVYFGDYIQIKHEEQYGRLAITGSVDNVDYDLSNGVKNLDLNNGYIYLGVPNLEYTTTLKTDLKAKLTSALDEAKKLNEDDYRFDTWRNFQNAVLYAEDVAGRVFVTNAALQKATDDLVTAQGKLKQNYLFHFQGVNSWEVMNIAIDYETMQLRVDGTAAYAHYGFYDQEYFNVTIKDINGNVLFSQGCKGAESPKALATALNGFKISEGDSIYIKHQESYSRMLIDGPVIDAPTDLSTGMKTATYGTNIHFQLVNGNLYYMT